MTVPATVVPLLVFEAADCHMAVLASEVAHLERSGREGFSPDTSENPFRPLLLDLGEYFGDRGSEGPWLQWARGTRAAWLRVRRVIDVVPVSLADLTPMPALLRRQTRTRAFLAAGVQGAVVFLLLDPGRLARHETT